MDHFTAIEEGLKAKTPYHEIARKVFLTYPTKAFVGAEEQQFSILNAIAAHFEAPITTIHVVGSAKTGRSFHKKRDFTPGGSDLDVAIIDTRLFVKYAEIVFKTSKGYADNSAFPLKQGRPTHEEYIRYLSRGIFRPDLMTVGPERARWNNFFDNLSTQHTNLFGSITACIYLSETFFEYKQRSTIRNFSLSKAV